MNYVVNVLTERTTHQPGGSTAKVRKCFVNFHKLINYRKFSLTEKQIHL